tara:strand:- start:479 stop:739 length:261 start_codon:yes stop_codon:yes gene_type:complete
MQIISTSWLAEGGLTQIQDHGEAYLVVYPAEGFPNFSREKVFSKRYDAECFALSDAEAFAEGGWRKNTAAICWSFAEGGWRKGKST